MEQAGGSPRALADSSSLSTLRPAGAFYRLRPRWTVRPGLSRAGSLWIAKSLKLGREVRFRSMTAAQILADPVLLDNASRVIGHASTPPPARARVLAERVEELLAGSAPRLGKLLDLLGPELGDESALGTICRLFLRGRLHLGLRGVPLSDRTEVNLRPPITD